MTNGQTIVDRKRSNGDHSHDIKILMYHRIVDDKNLSHRYPQVCVHVRDFRHHLALLERWGFTAITFEDYQLCLEGELNLPKKPVILTFDDGYVDTFQHAVPLLQEFGTRAVFFVLGNQQISTNIWDEKIGLPRASLINEKQILELHGAGFEIGSHSMTHAVLPALSREQAWEEILRSRALLEILLNAPVKSFAFPYGLADTMTKKLVKDAGYSIGCATYAGRPRFGTDPFDIHRIVVPGTSDTLGFALRVLAPFEYYSWLRWKTKLLLFAHRNGKRNGQLLANEIIEAADIAKEQE
ncbi:MAG: polysaccharide deacetylase family protein [Ignavibacteriae bacterium]|nr:polysaccharide deacetylase family protein [Ignavibacteriota bacterium]